MIKAVLMKKETKSFVVFPETSVVSVLYLEKVPIFAITHFKIPLTIVITSAAAIVSPVV